MWRVEVQLGSSWLREFGAGTPDEPFERLDAIWHYVVGRVDQPGRAWLRFVLPGTATRIERRQTDPRSRLLQEVSFAGLKPVERVDGDSGGVSPTNLVGSLLSMLSSHHELDSLSGPIAQVLREDFSRAADHVLRDRRVLETYERRRDAARARHSSPADRKVEP